MIYKNENKMTMMKKTAKRIIWTVAKKMWQNFVALVYHD